MYIIKITGMNRISRFKKTMMDLEAKTQVERVAMCKPTIIGCFTGETETEANWLRRVPLKELLWN